MNATENRTTPWKSNADTTMRGHRAGLGILAAVVACAGCAVAPAGEATSAGAPPGNASAVAPAAATVSIQGLAHASDGTPVDGVAVCLRPDGMTTDNGSCTTSDRSGAWKLAGAPAGSLVAITFVKAGFYPTLRPVDTATTDMTLAAGDGTLITSGDAATMMGGAMDPEGGHLVFSTSIPGMQSATPASVALGAYSLLGGYHAAPVYFGADGKPAPGASSGTSGVFANVPPGTYVVRFYGASVACSNVGGLYGYPFTLQRPDGQARLGVPVVAGFLTAPVAATCAPVGS